MEGNFKKLVYFPVTEKARLRFFMDNDGNRFAKWTLETRIRKVNSDGNWYTVLIMETFEDTYENYHKPEVQKICNERILGQAYIHLMDYKYSIDYNMIDEKQISERERLCLPLIIKATDG